MNPPSAGVVIPPALISIKLKLIINTLNIHNVMKTGSSNATNIRHKFTLIIYCQATGSRWGIKYFKAI